MFFPDRIENDMHKSIAIKIAPQLAKLIDGFLAGANAEELKTFLWDNKIGILRVMEKVAEL